MALKVTPELRALFGSETRVRTLAPLANASTPLSAYRIAGMVGVPRTKVYAELRRLATAGVIRMRSVDNRRWVWELLDPDVRRLLRRKARIVWAGDLMANASRLAGETRRLVRVSRRNPIDPRLIHGPFKPRHAQDFERRPEKDALLAKLGLPVSRRAGLQP